MKKRLKVLLLVLAAAAVMCLFAACEAEPATYTVTFVSEGVTVDTQTVEEGAAAALPSPDPSKEATAQYTYTFAGWSAEEDGEVLAELPAVMADATYYAVFTESVREYTVTYKNGDEVLYTATAEYGAKTPAYSGEAPEKAADAQYTYTFSGWGTVAETVTQDVTYTAQFTETLNKYAIVFMNGDQQLSSEQIAYGTVPAYDGAAPSKAATAQYTYTFAGWSAQEGGEVLAELPAVTGAATYYAVFTATVNKYAVTFTVDGESAGQQQVEYGSSPQALTAPVREGFTFNGYTKGGEAYDFTDTVVTEDVKIDLVATWLYGGADGVDYLAELPKAVAAMKEATEVTDDNYDLLGDYNFYLTLLSGYEKEQYDSSADATAVEAFRALVGTKQKNVQRVLFIGDFSEVDDQQAAIDTRLTVTYGEGTYLNKTGTQGWWDTAVLGGVVVNTQAEGVNDYVFRLPLFDYADACARYGMVVIQMGTNITGGSISAYGSQLLGAGSGNRLFTVLVYGGYLYADGVQKVQLAANVLNGEEALVLNVTRGSSDQFACVCVSDLFVAYDWVGEKVIGDLSKNANMDKEEPTTGDAQMGFGVGNTYTDFQGTGETYCGGGITGFAKVTLHLPVAGISENGSLTFKIAFLNSIPSGGIAVKIGGVTVYTYETAGTIVAVTVNGNGSVMIDGEPVPDVTVPVSALQGSDFQVVFDMETASNWLDLRLCNTMTVTDKIS